MPSVLLRRGSLLAAVLCLAQSALAQTADPRRRVVVERYGITVRAPQAWELITWGEDDRAFVLRLPQEDDSPVGYVACELSVAPETLESFRERQQADDLAEQQRAEPGSRLTKNALEDLDEQRFGPERAAEIGQRLISVREHRRDDGLLWYEEQIRLISHDTLYTFTLATDEAHYEAYRLDFEELLVSANFTPPHTGLQKMPEGYWLQQDFRFALKLPQGWKPGFGPSDKVLFFASGKTHGNFTDSLRVLATPARPIDPRDLQKTMADTVKQQDPLADVADCSVVRQGDRDALETVIHTRRGGHKVTILERRFCGKERNYEIRFICEPAEFEKIAGELRAALDSFVDAPAAMPPKTIL
ncbi:MAG: hypothetical protein AB7O62_15915 [Pirellulales bacterium]